MRIIAAALFLGGFAQTSPDHHKRECEPYGSSYDGYGYPRSSSHSFPYRYSPRAYRYTPYYGSYYRSAPGYYYGHGMPSYYHHYRPGAPAHPGYRGRYGYGRGYYGGRR